MKYLSFGKTMSTISAALLLALAGCVNEPFEPAPDANYSGTATVRLTIPGMATPSTRALSGEQEKQINSVDVLVFRNSDNKLVQWKSVSASAIAPSSDAWMFRIKDLVETDNITVAVVANAPAEVTSMLSAVGGTMANPLKNAVLEKLTYAFTGVKWITSGAGTMYLPMYGELPVSGSIYASLVQDIELKWMVAKIDVVNAVAPGGTPVAGDFKLTAVHLVNHNQNGYIAPKWNASGAPFAEDPQMPWLPTAPNPKTWAANGDQQTYTVDAPSGGEQQLSNEIYTFESWAAYSPSEDPAQPNPAAPANATRLILEGEYTDGSGTHTYYYPVDFTYPQDAGTQTTKYMPLLRNHRYLVNIVKAEGRGYDHISEAVAASGVISNLKTRIIVVDESGIRYIVFNGQYFLGVNEKSFTAAAAGQQNVELQISTNYTGGWRAAVENPADTWLTLGAASGLITDKMLTFGAATLTGDEWEARTGTILLTAGRLDMRIPVTQGEYKIVVEGVKSIYHLNGSIYNFTVKSNCGWRIKSVTPSVAGLLDLQPSDNLEVGTAGVSNFTTGTTINFKTATAGSSNLSGTVTVVFESTDNPKKFTDKTIILNMSSEYYPPMHTGWAGSNIYWDGSKLTFDDVGVTGHALYQGVYFQWGSLTGISSVGHYSENTTLYPPAGGTTSGTGWTSIPRVYEIITSHPPTGTSPSNPSTAYSERDRARLYEITNEATGLGDICKYLTNKGWAPAGKKWRMPTSQEFEAASGVYGTVGGYNDQTSDDATGKYYISSYKTKQSTGGAPWFPASGYRFVEDGLLYDVGRCGYYWSGSPSSNGPFGYNLSFFSNNIATTYHSGCAYGFPVRCVRAE